MKELRITATLQVPDDAFEQVEKMAAIKPHIEALAKEMGVPVEARIVTAKGPQVKKVAVAAPDAPADTEVVLAGPHGVVDSGLESEVRARRAKAA